MASSRASARNRRLHALIERFVHDHPRSRVGDLFQASRDSEIGRLNVMVEQMCAKDRESIRGATMLGFGLLHVAAHFGSVEVCKYLVENLRMDVDAGDVDGVTPLSYASLQGEEDVTAYLLEYGADPNKTNLGGRTPLHNAAENGNSAVVSLLLSAGGSSDLFVATGTPVHIAASYGNSDALKILLDNHANPNCLSRVSGTSLVTALHATAYGVSESDSLECIKLLVQGGADMNMACPNTALVEATIAGLSKCIKYLLETGADPNIPDALYRCTPIEIAAYHGDRKNMELLFPFTSPIKGVPNWTVEGIIAHEKSKSSIPKLICETPSLRTTCSRTRGDLTEDNGLNFYTPRQKKSKTNSIINQRVVQSVGEKRRSGTIQRKRCKRMLEYDVSSDSSSSPSPPSSKLGILTLQGYADRFKLKLKKSVRVPHQNATRVMARPGLKVVLRRSFMAMTKKHHRNRTLDGNFNATNFFVDLLDRSVTLEAVTELRYSDSGFKKDRQRFVFMVETEVFAGEKLPDDVAYWLKLIKDQEDLWESRLLGNHIYMLDSRLAFGLFKAFCSTIHSLRTDKRDKYEDLRLSPIFDKYYQWRTTFDFQPLNDTLTYKDEDPVNESGGDGYDPDIMGLIWLFRCCWAHRAQKYPHLLVAVLFGEGNDFMHLLSDIQRVLFEYGILRDI